MSDLSSMLSPSFAHTKPIEIEDKPTFPNLLSEFIYVRTYSRWMDEDLRRETWSETVDRYIEFLATERPVVPTHILREAREAILSFHVMPSMRALWSAGEAARRDNTCMYNCMGVETQFITRQGVKRFSDFRDGDRVTVLTHTGAWRQAVVHSYGQQQLFEIEISMEGLPAYRVRATRNHDWLTSSGSRTRDLQVGVEVAHLPNSVDAWQYADSDPVARYYWSCGYVYGAGEIVEQNGEVIGSKVQLEGETKAQFLSRFREVGFSVNSSGECRGRYIRTLPFFENERQENVVAFARGYLDAVGHTVQTSNPETVDFIRRVLPTVGVHSLSNPDGGHGFVFTSMGSCVVQAIRESAVETVWCLEVEGDRSFVFPNGIVTGNCSFIPIESLRAFSEALHILMCGTGVGFSVEKKFVDNLPQVGCLTNVSVPYLVEDSTEGWADSLLFGMEQWFKGNRVVFDYSGLRARGVPLKIKGGRASGPEPLQRLHSLCEETILSASGRKLKPIECHDIACAIGDIVHVGGFRRAALISFSDPEDEEMRHAKDWTRGDFPKIRYMSNNSAFWESKPDEETFWKEWRALAASGSGERGFYRMPPEKRAQRRGDFRSNPCVTGDTRVMTEHGLVQIKDLVGLGSLFAIDRRFNEGVHASSTTGGAYKTGTKDVFLLSTEDGFEVKATADHRFMTVDGWKEAQELQVGDLLYIANTRGLFGDKGSTDEGLLAGWVAGGGLSVDETGVPHLTLFDNDDTFTIFFDAVERLGGVRSAQWNDGWKSLHAPYLQRYLEPDRSLIPEYVWQGTESCQRSYLSALFSASALLPVSRSTDNPLKSKTLIQIQSLEHDFLREVQVLLLNFGVVSRIRGHGLYINNVNLVRFHEKIGFLHKDGQTGLAHVALQHAQDLCSESFTTRFRALTPCGVEDVYDVTIPVSHSFVANGFVVHNCGEINLRYTLSEDPWTGKGGAGSFCNLTAAVMRAGDTRESFAEKVRIAAWLGVIQASFTHFPYLREGWQKICDEDRLLGVDITGQCDNPALSNDHDTMIYFNRVARETAAEASAWLGINMPAAITCGKPSGNTSQLADCASGFHPRYAPYYIRRVRIDGKDPLTALLRDSGVPMFKENGMGDLPDEEVPVWVVQFPVKAPEGAMIRDSETAIEMCERYLHIMRTWCGERGHNQSATIYVRDNEWDEVGRWVFEHFDEVTGLSFLPYDGGMYKLAPYQEITQAEYEAALAEMPHVDFSLLTHYEREDRGQGSTELACSSGSCELI